MKLKLQAAGAALVAASLIASFAYAADKAPAKKKAKTETQSSAEQIQALREELQKQINNLKSDLSSKDAELKQAQDSAAKAEAAAAKAEAAAASQNQAVSDNAAAVSSLQSTVDDMKGANASLAAQLSETTSKAVKKSDLSEIAIGKFKIGATVFADYTYYSDWDGSTQFVDNMTKPTSAADQNYNAFEITRTYFNLFYTPNDAVSVRITPDIYRTAAATAVSSTTTPTFVTTQPTSGTYYACTSGGVSGWCTTLTTTNTLTTDQNLSFRLKYAYMDLNKLFANVKYISKDKVTFGQTQNPLTDWEEGLTGHRYTYKMPMDFSSGLSSTYAGVKMQGPVEFNGKEYLDYSVGVFTNGAYSTTELSDTKQFMGRVTYYPMGTKLDRTGLGLTVFGNVAYSNINPSSASTKYGFDRTMVMAHYQTADKAYLLTGQVEILHDAAALGTNSFGYAFEGNARLGGKKSPFQAFGMFQEYEPKTNLAANDASKYMRTVGGIAYHFNKNLDIALTDSNKHYQSVANTNDANAVSVFTQYNF